ncbi:MAG: hypothetical protein KKI02_06240 [Planctomycetes bacterium]|nr:hypothetical protein [Planctomycetota bacterium]
MILPHVDDPPRLRGLYVYDFGEWTAVGYTAEEIAILLEDASCRGGKVYKIHRATPDGRMELRGVSPDRFNRESGLFFHRRELAPARADFEEVRASAEKTPPPCRAFLHLADREIDSPQRFVTALVFPAEYENEIGHWLTAIGFHGGDLAEGGTSHVSNYYEQRQTLLERQQLWSRPAIPSRSPEEVLASVRQAVQR